MFAGQYSSRAKKTQNSELAALFKLTENPEVISFAGGFPDPDWYLDEIIEITEKVIREKKGAALSYGPTPGLSDLREYLAARLELQGIAAKGADVLITAGSLQGLDIVGRIFLDPGDRVIVEAPTYIGAIATLQSLEAVLVQVPIDELGMQTDLLEDVLKGMNRDGQLPKFIYTIPNFQNPSGCTLSLERRRQLLRVAACYGIPVIEDNAYGELRFAGKELPLLKALDTEDLVIHLGTFSKIFSPGLRLGWLVARPELVEKAILFKQGTDQCSNTLGQLLALEYGRRGYIDKQVEVSAKSLIAKKDAALNALQEYFPAGSTWTLPEGGFYTWVTLPQTVNTVDILPVAVRDYQVAYVAGPSFHADRSGANKLRLCYSNPKIAQIAGGIEKLARALTVCT
ncbi:MAG: PLP-dependent aminotransferase family protein [Thermacetogeniaceae bacterium]